MKYGEGLFNRTRDTRAPGQPLPQPMAANAPSHGPAVAQPPGRAAPAPAPAEQAPRAEESAGSKLIVGPNIKLKGVEIHDCDTLVVEGRVEATMVLEGMPGASRRDFSSWHGTCYCPSLISTREVQP